MDGGVWTDWNKNGTMGSLRAQDPFICLYHLLFRILLNPLSNDPTKPGLGKLDLRPRVVVRFRFASLSFSGVLYGEDGGI